MTEEGSGRSHKEIDESSSKKNRRRQKLQTWGDCGDWVERGLEWHEAVVQEKVEPTRRKVKVVKGDILRRRQTRKQLGIVIKQRNHGGIRSAAGDTTSDLPSILEQYGDDLAFGLWEDFLSTKIYLRSRDTSIAGVPCEGKYTKLSTSSLSSDKSVVV